MDTARIPSYTVSSARIGTPGSSNSSFSSPTIPTVTPSEPPTPGNPQPYQPGWDPLAHGRPSLPIAFSTAITSLALTINGVSYTGGVVSFRHTERAKGSATGSLVLRRVTGLPDASLLPLGSPWALTVGFGARSKTYQGYLLGVKRTDGREGTQWDLELGGSLALLETRTGTQVPLYCGPDPRNSGQAARIATRATHLAQHPWPDGANILEPPQSLDGQNLSGYLNELYEPAGYWVRDAGYGVLVQAPGGNGSGFTLSQVLREIPYGGSARRWRRYRLRADYTLNQGYPTRTQTTREISPSTQIKPWDQGGKTETTITQTYLGSGVIRETRTIMGYYYSAPFTEPAGGSDPCDPLPSAPSRPLVWGSVSTETLNRRYVQHSSGAFVVVGETLTKSARPTTTIAGVTSSPNADLERIDRDYVVSFLNWPNVCPKHQEAYVSRFTERTYTPYLAEGASGSPIFKLTSSQLSETSVTGQLPSGDNWASNGLRWSTRSVSGGLNDADRWVTQQAAITDQPGPSVVWIRPETSEVSLGASITGTGTETSEPLTIPYAFSREQLVTAGRLRWLQEDGISRGLAVGVPAVLAPPTNATVTHNGQTYWVDAVNTEVSVDGAVSTVELGVLS